MKNIIEKVKALWGNKRIRIATIIVVLIGGYFILKGKAASTPVRYVTAAVVRGTLTSTVTGTGQIGVLNQLDLKPQGSGTITFIKGQEGQKVKAGDVIATLDQQSAVNQINQAKVSVAQAQANYDKVLAGATEDDVTLANLSVDSAQRSYNNAKNNFDVIKSQQDLAVAKAYSTLLSSGLEAVSTDIVGSTVTLTISGTYTAAAKGSFIITLYQTGAGMYYSVSGLASTSGPLTRGVALPLGSGLYITFSTSGTLNTSTTWTIDLPNVKSDSYVNNNNAYNAALQNQTQALNQAQSAIDSAQNSLTQAQTLKHQKTAPPTNVDVATAQVQVDAAKVQLSNAYTAYNNNIIRAPFDGIIAKIPAQKGDQAGASTIIATLITQQKVAEITLNELDASKVKLGQKATLTFSALDGYTATGQIGQLDILGTVTQNVVNYSLKVFLDTQDDQVKPGMSVSADIITDVKQDVLIVPSSAVKNSATGSFVQTLVNEQPVQHVISVGSSNDTETEISGDIKEGDEVVTQVISAAATAAAKTGTSLLPGLGGSTTTRRATGGAANATFVAPVGGGTGR